MGTLKDVAFVEKNTSLGVFGNATSGDTLGAAMTNAGDDTIKQVPQASEEGCKEAVKDVEEAFASQTHCRPVNFTPVSCIWENSVGIKYFAKVDVQPCEGHSFANLTIHKGSHDKPATLKDVAFVEKNTSLGFFGNETSGETLGAAMANAGDDTLGATLGSGQCIKANEPCPSDRSRCCSGYCQMMGGYVTFSMPLVCG